MELRNKAVPVLVVPGPGLGKGKFAEPTLEQIQFLLVGEEGLVPFGEVFLCLFVPEQQFFKLPGEFADLLVLGPVEVPQTHQLGAHEDKFVLELALHLVAIGVDLEAAELALEQLEVALQLGVDLLESAELVFQRLVLPVEHLVLPGLLPQPHR